MPDTRVEWGVSEGVLSIRLSSPETMNLLGVGTRKEIVKVLKAHKSDGEVRCVTVSSTGRAFSAGADMKFILGLRGRKAAIYANFVQSFLSYVENYAKPTIGLVNGLAVGGGLELLMVLDIVFASPESRFGQTELNVGLIPGGGGTQRLPRLVGARKAKEMIFTGRLISASEALEIGLVNKVVEADRLEEEAKETTAKIGQKNPENLRLAKNLISEGLKKGLQGGLDLESQYYSKVISSKESKASIREFLEKSAPR